MTAIYFFFLRPRCRGLGSATASALASDGLGLGAAFAGVVAALRSSWRCGGGAVALSTSSTSVVVWLGRHGAPLAAGAPALAHVCLNTVCLPPVRAPGELAEAVANMSGPSPFGESPFEDIFEKFSGI